MDDCECSEWFRVSRGLHQGCGAVASAVKPGHKAFAAATDFKRCVGYVCSDDEGVSSDLLHFGGEYEQGRHTKQPEERV